MWPVGNILARGLAAANLDSVVLCSIHSIDSMSLRSVGAYIHCWFLGYCVWAVEDVLALLLMNILALKLVFLGRLVLGFNACCCYKGVIQGCLWQV